MDDFGNYYFVELPSAPAHDCAVDYMDHDGGDVTFVSHSLRELIELWTKQAAANE